MTMRIILSSGLLLLSSFALGNERVIAIQQAEIMRLKTQLDKANSKSCYDILQMNPGAKNGVYKIYPTSAGIPVNVYCNMIDNGGGWTLVWKVGDTNAVTERESQTDKLVDPNIVPGVAKFSDKFVNQIRSNYAENENGYWIENLAPNCSTPQGGFISAACDFGKKQFGVPRSSACTKARLTYNGAWFDDGYSNWCQQNPADSSSYFCAHNGTNAVVLRTFLPGYPTNCQHSYMNTRVWVR